MYLIGENLNVMVKKIGTAMKARDPKPIQDLAVAETEAGMDYIDINLGPARKGGAELMEWVVNAVQEVTDLPLYLDTTNVEAIEAGLKAAKHDRGKPVINSVDARPERIESLMPLAKKYDGGIVALLNSKEGIPRDEAERGALAAELMAKAGEHGLADEDVWIDPIVLPVNTQQNQVQGCTNFMMMFRDLAPNCKSTCGLSNVSNGAPEHLRPLLNQTYWVILEKYGMGAAIMDAFDDELKSIMRGKRPEVTALINKVVDGEEFDLSKLSTEEINYIKTAKLLLGHSLYSDSWLEL